jgi:DNA-binding MarR family transcriptional regulator
LKHISNMTPTLLPPDRELTATREILLPDHSDHALRTLLYNLFTIGTRMEEVRRYLGSCIGITGPQFSLLMAIRELEGLDGVSVGTIAAYLHVAGTFVTADPRDRRVSLLRVRPAGAKAIEHLLPEVRQVNDTFFELESREGFDSLCRAADRMVEGSRRVLSLIRHDNVRIAEA